MIVPGVRIDGAALVLHRQMDLVRSFAGHDVAGEEGPVAGDHHVALIVVFDVDGASIEAVAGLLKDEPFRALVDRGARPSDNAER